MKRIVSVFAILLLITCQALAQTRKLSQIPTVGSAPALTDQVVGVTAGSTDNLFSLLQMQQTIIGSLPIIVSNGGTGNNSFTSNLPLIGAGTSAIAQGSVSGSTTKFATTQTGAAAVNAGCAQFDNGGNLATTGANCGNAGATAPGGVNTEVQINSSGAFAGDGGLFYNGTGNTGILTVGLLDLRSSGSHNGVGISSHNATSLSGTVTGDSNVAIGSSVLTGTLAGAQNVGIGFQALQVVTGGAGNVGVGPFAGTAITSGSNNVAVGVALSTLTTGNNNVAIGNAALNKLDTLSAMVAIGNGALQNYSAVGGGDNTSVAVGFQALQTLTAGQGNTAIGFQAMTASTSPTFNTAVGTQALQLNTTGSQNTAIGMQASDGNTIGNNNTSVGQFALGTLSTGSNNVGVGVQALTDFNGASSNNTVIGAFAMPGNAGLTTSGSGNTVVGKSAVFSEAGTTAGQETAFGFQALMDLNGAGNGNNVAVGYNTGRGITTGTGNTILGSNVTGLSAALTNAIVLATGDGTIRADWADTNSGAWTITGHIFATGLATTPGSKQPLCIDTATKQVYAGSGGAC